ncbi:uncharacterized protein LY79DRAFT_153309 [Colletotrichum navitas]|uniref:Uncharacterized protein n=1 Tax=Colletotrichum navitas TaxID=681940 RepID=A0AAD8Q1W1_9PEZI|nr:uncharacterized protein LY79DRAFT_153309 [Colletotrichum navitas]KAK1594316.1 hypothetical protein LY79DRAFT_153309 [Colletotrichum navitas]
MCLVSPCHMLCRVGSPTPRRGRLHGPGPSNERGLWEGGEMSRTHVFAKFLNLKLLSTASPSFTSAQRPAPSSVSSIADSEASSEPCEKRAVACAGAAGVVDMARRCGWRCGCSTGRGDDDDALEKMDDAVSDRGVWRARRRRRTEALISEEMIREGVGEQ